MSEIVKDGFCRFVIYDDSTSPDTYVTGTAFLPPQGPETQTEYFETAQGRRRVRARTRTLTMDVVDLENLWQIHAWRDAETPVKAILFGKHRNAQLDTACLLDSFPLNRGFQSVAAERIVLYTSDVSADWTQYVNLLQKTADGFVDNGSNEPTGWTLVGYDSAASSISSGVMAFDTNANPASIRLDVRIPANGLSGNLVQLTGSITVDSALTGGGTANLYVCPDGDHTDPDAQSVDISSTGRKSTAAFQWPSSAVSDVVSFIIYITGAATQSLSVSWPTLRVDGETTITRY